MAIRIAQIVIKPKLNWVGAACCVEMVVSFLKSLNALLFFVYTKQHMHLLPFTGHTAIPRP